MKYKFHFYYKLNAPIHAVVGAYLDCEHYEYIHKASVSEFRITEYKNGRLAWHQCWKILGIPIRQNFITNYILPSTFINVITPPENSSIFNIYRYLMIKTESTFAPIDDQQTLSITTVSLELPFFLCLFKKILKYNIMKLKIVLDLEDVAALDRKKAVYGKLTAGQFLHHEQFLIFKNEFSEVFKNKEAYSFDYDKSLITTPPIFIHELKFPYVKKFMKSDYFKISGFTPK